jgi:hypothetical protein
MKPDVWQLRGSRSMGEGVLADGLSEGGWVQLARAYRGR